MSKGQWHIHPEIRRRIVWASGSGLFAAILFALTGTAEWNTPLFWILVGVAFLIGIAVGKPMDRNNARHDV